MKNFKKVFLVLTISAITLTSKLYAAAYVEGRGHFYAKNSDQMRFVKDQLKFSAFKDVITKELKNMGLDQAQFWQQFDAKFEEYFEPIKQSLKEKYKIDDPKVTAKQKMQYGETLRIRRLRTRAKFGKLTRVVRSFSIKNVSRSTTMPNSRYMNISAKINRKLLRNIYFKFTSQGQARHYHTLYITADFQIEAMTWLDAGVEVENDFTKVIKEHWKKWFLENMNSYVDNIVITDVVTHEKISSYFKLVEKKIGGESAEESNIDAELRNSLWLKISSKIKKLSDDTIMNTKEYEVSGDFLLIDLKSNRLIKHYDFVDEKKSLGVENNHDLSSNLASMVYRMPIPSFQEIPKNISALPPSLEKIGLEVFNVKNILDLIKLKEILATKGIAYRFESEINSYSGTVGKLLLSFQGTNDNIVQTLNSMNNVELEPGRIIQVDSTVSPFKLTIKEDQKVENNETSS